jgi:hypothetical protein
MRRLLVVSASLLVSACATAPRQAEPEQVPAIAQGHGGLIGMTADDLVRRFGTPALQIREGNSLKLQFRNPQCVLDAFLYPDGSSYRVTYVDTRTRALAAVDQATCARSLQAS